MTMPIAAQALIGLHPPRAILFDWDNTLVDTWATIHDALNFLMRAMDRPEWSLDETRQRVRLSLREAFPLYFGDVGRKRATFTSSDSAQSIWNG